MRANGAPRKGVDEEGQGGAPDAGRRLRLREMRLLAGLKQGDVAALVGVSSRTYGAWERGVNNIPSDRICDLCDALGCTPNDLFGYADDDRSEQMMLVADETISYYKGYRHASPEMQHIVDELLTYGTKSKAR